MEGIPLAKCPLKEVSDQSNYLYLTDKNLIVRINNRQFIYNIDNLISLNWTTKKLLFPIVSGGFIASLSVIAYMNGILHPWLLLFLFISGILLFYYGFAGVPALVLNFSNSQEHYLIKNSTLYLERFVDFVNQYLKQKKIPEYYLKISLKEWENAQHSGYINISKPIKLYEAVPKVDNFVILKLSVEDNNINITYMPSEENKGLIPCVTDNIPLAAIFQL